MGAWPISVVACRDTRFEFHGNNRIVVGNAARDPLLAREDVDTEPDTDGWYYRLSRQRRQGQDGGLV